MKIISLIFYITLFSTLFLNIFSTADFGPQYHDPDIYRVKDSIYVADSLESVRLSKPFNQNTSEYKEQFKKELSSVCKKYGYNNPPSLYGWTVDGLTGVGLIFYNNNCLIIIPILFYLIIISLVLLNLIHTNRFTLQVTHILMILSGSSLLVLVIINFPNSFIFYLMYLLLVPFEIMQIKKLNTR